MVCPPCIQSSSPIMNLPAELLIMIFEFFTTVVSIHHPETDENRCYCVLFSIRATCRKFRGLVNELPMWFDPNFRLVDVIPCPNEWDERDDWEAYEAGFLRLLFQDTHLVQRLERRTTWHFMNLQTLLAAIDCVPSFSLGTTSIGLFSDVCSPRFPQQADWGENSINDSLRRLGVCQSLTSLLIYSQESSTLDLSLIGEGCPSLKRLHLLVIDKCRGKLRGLYSLEEFQTSLCWAFSPFDGLIPIDSAASLTHLALLFGYEEFWLEGAFNNGAFKAFVNLKSLYVHPLSVAVCDFLLHSTIELKEFRTTVIKEHGETVILKVITMFSKPSLRNLRSLCLAVEYHPDWRRFYQSIIESITTNLTNIEEMVLGMAMDASWFSMFAKLCELKRLIWFVPAEACQASRVTSDQSSKTEEESESDEDTDYDEDEDYYSEDTTEEEDDDDEEEDEEADTDEDTDYDEDPDQFHEDIADYCSYLLAEKLKSVLRRHISVNSPANIDAKCQNQGLERN